VVVVWLGLPVLAGSVANPAFSLGWWNNRAAANGSE